jgi:aminoglycoside phosphotransferase (APT) family kinase protein
MPIVTESGSAPAADPTPPLVDPDALSAWVDEQPALPGAGPVEVERLAAGHSNLTFVVRRAGADGEWVLRRPPRGPLLPTAHDVLREYRVIELLAHSGTGVRVPTALAACDDPEVIGAPFYLMQRGDGIVIRDELPDWLADDDRDTAGRHALGLDVVDALAELHLAPYEPFVAAGLGKAGGYLDRQLRRWRGQREGIQRAAADAGGRARDLPDYDAVSAWLVDHLPDEGDPCVVHGDYKLDNLLVTGGSGPGAAAAPRVTAILDWEMATVGDGLADLSWLLSFWPNYGEEGPLGSRVTAAPGFPDRGELVDRYADKTGRAVHDVEWFTTLAIWKLAILLEASYHRHLAGQADDPFFAELEQYVPALLARAREVCGA